MNVDQQLRVDIDSADGVFASSRLVDVAGGPGATIAMLNFDSGIRHLGFGNLKWMPIAELNKMTLLVEVHTDKVQLAYLLSKSSLQPVCHIVTDPPHHLRKFTTVPCVTSARDLQAALMNAGCPLVRLSFFGHKHHVGYVDPAHVAGEQDRLMVDPHCLDFLLRLEHACRATLVNG